MAVVVATAFAVIVASVVVVSVAIVNVAAVTSDAAVAVFARTDVVPVHVPADAEELFLFYDDDKFFGSVINHFSKVRLFN